AERVHGEEKCTREPAGAPAAPRRVAAGSRSRVLGEPRGPPVAAARGRASRRLIAPTFARRRARPPASGSTVGRPRRRSARAGDRRTAPKWLIRAPSRRSWPASLTRQILGGARA